jgi:hypothetical protein
MLRKDENLNKFSAKELADYRQAQAEYTALAHEDYDEDQKKASVILNGLQKKYGFSEAGAKATVALIKKGWHMYANQTYLDMAIEDGKFGSDANKIAGARNAYNYFHNVK